MRLDDIRVKICGLTQREDAAHAVACGADYIGFVFTDSPRRADPAEVARWLDTVRGVAEVVGVFRDAPLEQVQSVIHALDLDLVQLHGREAGAAWLELPVRVIEARAVAGEGAAESRFQGAAWADLLDSGGGGTGRPFDWRLAAPLVRGRRVFLAGGLTAANVARAVQQVRPFAVDVASGVELRPGRKDPSLVARFIEAARQSGREPAEGGRA
jgi:phosphoribosylanthranilate isomerase